MKTLLLSAAAALSLTGPVFAETAADFAIRHFAQSHEGGDGARLPAETSAGDVAFVAMHFAQDREGGDGPRPIIPTGNEMIVSTSNSDLATFAAEKLDTGERGFK